MKLLDRKSAFLIPINLIVLLLAGLAFYQLVIFTINRNVRNILQVRKDYVINQMSISDSLYQYQHFSANLFTILPLDRPAIVPEYYSDTTFYDSIHKQHLLFSQLTFSATIRSQPYLITVRKSLIDETELLKEMVLLLIVQFVVLVFILSYVNRRVSHQIWLPFYAILKRMRTYRIDQRATITFPETDIAEFHELITDLQRLMNQISDDYRRLKEFTENASHEIQTPLAILEGKLELLLQSEDLSSANVELVYSAKQALNRLARLNESLLLLTRIENRQFPQTQPVDLRRLVVEKINYLEELIELKDIRLTKKLTQAPTVTINPGLGEILVGNLIGNAIKHNQPGGRMIIALTASEFSVSNTGAPLQVDPSTLFERFAKSNPQSTSLGLGLAICRAICETYGMQIRYTYENELHCIAVSFGDASVTSSIS